MNMKIKEVIVVEGHHDTCTLKQYFDVDTIETNGSAINKETIEYIKKVNERRGIIIFTDPDYPGERIRNIINQAIPNCKNAFLEKSKALGNHKVGIEHANKEDLEEALRASVTYNDALESDLTMMSLYELGIVGANNSQEIRDKICKKYHLGKCNGKTMLNRLRFIGLQQEDIKKVLEDE